MLDSCIGMYFIYCLNYTLHLAVSKTQQNKMEKIFSSVSSSEELFVCTCPRIANVNSPVDGERAIPRLLSLLPTGEFFRCRVTERIPRCIQKWWCYGGSNLGLGRTFCRSKMSPALYSVISPVFRMRQDSLNGGIFRLAARLE